MVKYFNCIKHKCRVECDSLKVNIQTPAHVILDAYQLQRCLFSFSPLIIAESFLPKKSIDAGNYNSFQKQLFYPNLMPTTYGHIFLYKMRS